jgi:hypothetical protein
MSGREAVRAFHPPCMFALHRREAARGDVGPVVVEQFDHHMKERRLRAAEIIGARAVGDVPMRFDQVGHRVDDAVCQFLLSVADETEHRKEAVPIIDFTKAPAWHDMAVLYGKRRSARGLFRRAGKVFP